MQRVLSALLQTMGKSEIVDKPEQRDQSGIHEQAERKMGGSNRSFNGFEGNKKVKGSNAMPWWIRMDFCWQ